MADDTDSAMVRREKDGRPFRIGTPAEVAWIESGTASGRTITAAIPPVFDAYATIIVPEEEGEGLRLRHDRAVLTLLEAGSADQAWWLGFLDTGGDDVIFPDAPMVQLYAGWPYVLVEADPERAANLRHGSHRFFQRSLPDLIFPADRSWLLSTLWDDDWRCLGGTADLVDRFRRHPDLQTHSVRLGEDAVPPGHQAF